jgi:hypothetical protein
MKQLLAQLPESQHILFRGDSGYFVGDLLQPFQGDLLAAKITLNVDI